MDQQVDPAHGLDHGCGRRRVAGECDRASGTSGAEHLLGEHRLPGPEDHRLPALERAALPAGRDAERVRHVGVESPGTGRLDNGIAERFWPVVDGERANLVVVTPDHRPRLEFDRLQWVGELPEDAPQGSQQVAQPCRPIEGQGNLAAAQREGLQHPGQSEIVIRMKVGQEHLFEVDQAHVGPEKLPLRTLAAVDQQAIAAAADERCRRRPLGCGSRTRRPEEHDVQIHAASVPRPSRTPAYGRYRGCAPARGWSRRRGAPPTPPPTAAHPQRDHPGRWSQSFSSSC